MKADTAKKVADAFMAANGDELERMRAAGVENGLQSVAFQDHLRSAVRYLKGNIAIRRRKADSCPAVDSHEQPQHEVAAPAGASAELAAAEADADGAARVNEPLTMFQDMLTAK